MNSGFVYVPVPVDQVRDVYWLLSRERDEDQGPGQPAMAPEPVRPTLPDANTVAMAYRDSGEKMRLALEFLAENAGLEVPMTELADAVSYERRSMAGMLGAFLRRWKNRYYGGDDSVRPFNAYWDSARGMVIYSMPPAVAEAVKREVEQSR